MNYSQNLYTPHHKQNTGDIPQPLSFITDTVGIAEELDHTPVPDQSNIALAAADFLAAQVRKALWFPQHTKAGNDFIEMGVSQPPKLQDLETEQAADCIGFSIVTSELLSKAEIDHWIGFSNGHATLLIDGEQKDSLYLVDSLSPELDQELTPALDGSTIEQIRDDMYDYGRSAIKLNPGVIIAQSHARSGQTNTERPWLNAGKGSKAIGRDLDIQHEAESIIMGIFPAKTGGMVLRAYSAYQHGLIDGDRTQVAKALQTMGPRFPDMDARKKHTGLKLAIDDLVQKGDVNGARDLTATYFETFSFIDDSRFVEAEDDCLLRIARSAQNEDIAKGAAKKYKEALKMPRAYHSAIRGKLGKLANQFESARS